MPKRSLSCCGTHELLRQILFHQLRLAEASESGGRKNDAVVFALFQLAHARIDVAAQRMNHEVGAKRLQLRLSPQAAGPDLRAFGQRVETVVVD